MKAFILYRPNSDHARTVEMYVHDFNKRTNRTIELLSLDTVEGSTKAELYGVTSYPALLAVDDSGVMQREWQGGQFPLMDELSYYTIEN